MAADQGLSASQLNLGVLYENGQGILQSYLLAHIWYQMAVNNGHAGAQDYLDTAKSNMTQSEISEAEIRSGVCFASNYNNCD